MYSGVLVYFSTFFVFHAKSGTTNTHRNGLSDLSNECPSSHDSNHIEALPKFASSVEKNRFEIFDFLSVSRDESQQTCLLMVVLSRLQ